MGRRRWISPIDEGREARRRRRGGKLLTAPAYGWCRWVTNVTLRLQELDRQLHGCRQGVTCTLWRMLLLPLLWLSREILLKRLKLLGLLLVPLLWLTGRRLLQLLRLLLVLGLLLLTRLGWTYE